MKTKKRLTKIFAFICTFSLVAQFAFAGVPVSAATTNVNYVVTGAPTVGNTIDIAVNVSNISDLYGASVDFTYDTSVLEVQSITKGSVVTSDFQCPVGEVKNGQANLAFTLIGDDTKGIAANGTIAIIKAKVLKGGKTINLATDAKVKLSDSKVGVIAVNAAAISIVTKDKEQPTTVLQPGTYEETVSGIDYVGIWGAEKNSSYSGGSAKISNTNGSYVTFKFNGNAIKLYSLAGATIGISKITIDNQTYTVDSYSSSTKFNNILLDKSGLSTGIHTVKVEVTNSKNLNSKNYYQVIDKIVVSNGEPTDKVLQPGTYEETASGIDYVGSWSAEKNSNYYGGSAKISNNNGSYITFKFNGTGIFLGSLAAPTMGIGKVTIDNQVFTLDSYLSTTRFKNCLLSKNGLSSGIHTVKIEVTNSKNTNSKNYYQVLDNIIIY